MDKIRQYVEEIFEQAPKTNRAFELKEEIIANSNDKYNDLLAQGKTPEEAFKQVVAGIGDMNEFIDVLRAPDGKSEELRQAQQKKTALVVTIAVGLYIFAVILLIILEEALGVDDVISVSSFLGVCAIATCTLIYHFMSRPKYKKADETIVEEFKQWQSETKQSKALHNSIMSIVWILILIVYFVISFAFNSWPVSWIIFLVGLAIDQILRAIFSLKKSNGK